MLRTQLECDLKSLILKGDNMLPILRPVTLVPAGFITSDANKDKARTYTILAADLKLPDTDKPRFHANTSPTNNATTLWLNWGGSGRRVLYARS